MIKKVYSIRDAKASVFNQPFFKITHGEAERDFHRLVNDDKSMVWQYPDDYDLYYLGTYDDVKGVFTSLETPEHIAKAALVKQGASTMPNISQ